MLLDKRGGMKRALALDTMERKSGIGRIKILEIGDKQKDELRRGWTALTMLCGRHLFRRRGHAGRPQSKEGGEGANGSDLSEDTNSGAPRLFTCN